MTPFSGSGYYFWKPEEATVGVGLLGSKSSLVKVGMNVVFGKKDEYQGFVVE